jgi:curli biogenesis system outer membrane secretion channel CsgG
MKTYLLALLVLLVAAPLAAQKVGILSFEDASGVGGNFGEQVAKFIRSEMLKDKKYLPKFIAYKPEAGQSSTIDVETAIAVGKKNGVDYVVIGTILEAEATSNSTGLGGIRVLGQSVGASARQVAAKITLQGDLISVKEGKLLESLRVDGKKTETSVGTNAYTQWGSLNADNRENDSPTGKALREACENLVSDMNGKIK